MPFISGSITCLKRPNKKAKGITLFVDSSPIRKLSVRVCAVSGSIIYRTGWFRTRPPPAWQKITGQSHLPNLGTKTSQKVYSNLFEVPVRLAIVIFGEVPVVFPGQVPVVPTLVKYP